MSTGEKEAPARIFSVRGVVETMGEVVNDGLLELIANDRYDGGLALLHWKKGQDPKIGSRVYVDDCCFVPPSVSRTGLTPLLPKNLVAYGSANQLFDETADLLRKSVGMSDTQAALSTYWAFGSHLADCLPVAPTLLIRSDASLQGGQMLRTLALVTRHPVLLSGMGSSAFDLPIGNHLTFLINQPAGNAIFKRFLESSQQRGFLFPRGGRLFDLFSFKAVSVGNRRLRGQLADTCIPLTLAPPPLNTLNVDGWIDAAVVDGFQGKFLLYRLENHEEVRAARFTAPQLTGGTFAIASSLGRCFPRDPKLQSELLRLLSGRDEASRAARAVEGESLVLEAMLALCHKDSTAAIYVGQVSEIANGIAINRGAERTLTPRGAGELLRSLDLFVKRDKSGYSFQMTEDVRRRIHELARAFSVPSLANPLPGCPWCEERKCKGSAE